MHYFGRLNETVNDCKVKQPSESDIQFLKREKVSGIAIEASARLFITEEKELAEVTGCLMKYLI